MRRVGRAWVWGPLVLLYDGVCGRSVAGIVLYYAAGLLFALPVYVVANRALGSVWGIVAAVIVSAAFFRVVATNGYRRAAVEARDEAEGVGASMAAVFEPVFAFGGMRSGTNRVLGAVPAEAGVFDSPVGVLSDAELQVAWGEHSHFTVLDGVRSSPSFQDLMQVLQEQVRIIEELRRELHEMREGADRASTEGIRVSGLADAGGDTWLPAVLAELRHISAEQDRALEVVRAVFDEVRAKSGHELDGLGAGSFDGAALRRALEKIGIAKAAVDEVGGNSGYSGILLAALEDDVVRLAQAVDASRGRERFAQ